MSKYIDKDKVLEYIIFGVVGKDVTCGELKRAIESFPTIEVNERIGEWIKATGVAPPEFTGRYVCSNCGSYALMDMPYGNRQELSRFCPNCGAMMKGADDETD